MGVDICNEKLTALSANSSVTHTSPCLIVWLLIEPLVQVSILMSFSTSSFIHVLLFASPQL